MTLGLNGTLSEEQRYPQYQKLVYAVFMAQRRLRHYFQEHHITVVRSEEHTSELQSLRRISYAVFCLKKK